MRAAQKSGVNSSFSWRSLVTRWWDIATALTENGWKPVIEGRGEERERERNNIERHGNRNIRGDYREVPVT
jgi:hypothetical protein